MYESKDESIDFGQILEDTRRALKDRRGWFGKVHAEDRLQGRQYSGDMLDVQWEENELLLKKGRVVWGALIQANSLLFRLDYMDAPGELVCSLDPHFDTRPLELLEVAQAAFRLKGTQPDHPGLRMIADDITNEMSRSLGKPIPPELSSPLTVGEGLKRHSLVFQRPHLPERLLTQNFFPVLAHPSCKSVTFLPGSCWGIQMRAFWKLSDEARQQLNEEKEARESPRRQLPVVRLTSFAIEKLQQYARPQTGNKVIVRVGLTESLREYSFRIVDAADIARSDHVLHQDGVTIVVSKRDAEYLWGTELDYEVKGNHHGFVFHAYTDQGEDRIA